MAKTKNSLMDAELALAAFRGGRLARGELTGDDRENVTDLITDLMHLVDTDSERFDDYEGDMVADTAMSNWFDEHYDTP
jgi:hypothetical protein